MDLNPLERLMSAVSPLTRFILRAALLTVLTLLILLLALRWTAYNREVEPLGALPAKNGRLVETAEGGIFVLEAGPTTGAPLLFAHGTAAWSGLWQPTLDHVAAQGFRAIAFDMPPFGFSEHAKDADYSRQRQADRILALIEALDIHPIAVAHSIGAGPVAEAVLTRPEAFAGLVIVDGAIALNSHKSPKSLPAILRNETLREFLVAATLSNPVLTRSFLRNFMTIKDAATPEVIEILKMPMTRQGYTAAASQWVPQLFETPRNAKSTRPEEWQKLTLPTAIIWGETDTVTPLEQGEELKSLIAASSLVVLTGAGHIPQLEAPEVFRKELTTVLNNLVQRIDANVNQ